MKKVKAKLTAVVLFLSVIVAPAATMFTGGGGVINPW